MEKGKSAKRVKGDGLGKTGGRKKGTPNKIPAVVRKTLSTIINDYTEGEGIGDTKMTLYKDLQCLDAKERVTVITNLMPYVMPKLQSVEVKAPEAQKTYLDELKAMADAE